MQPFSIAGTQVQPGKRARVELEVARLYDFTRMNVPVEVIHGREDGPVLFVTAAIHGDEINGVEIIKRLLHQPVFSKMHGTLIAVPIVNVFGFNARQRYLPDRRDLNRCFPGSEDGPLANQLAHAIMENVIRQSTYGIDLHTGAVHRTNLPHIRASIDSTAMEKLAASFGAPLVIHSGLRDGSLREAAREAGVPVLLFEGGEALRFNESVIRLGVRGVLSVMRYIGMLPENKQKIASIKGKVARDSYWVRAPHSGMLTSKHTLGDAVKEGEVLGHVSDPFGQHRFAIVAKSAGIIVGMTVLPLLNEGDAVFHIATFHSDAAMHEAAEQQQQVLTGQTDTYVT
jgi:predicted deacylase